MTASTKNNIAIGVGVAALVLLVGGLGYSVGRSGGDEVSLVASTTTTTAEPTTTLASPKAVPTTTPTTIAPPRDFPDLFEEFRGAVANVDVVTCDSASQGTAFLVATDLAYTAWHVVDNAAQVALTVQGASIEASVIGHDAERDIAILRLAEPVADATVLQVSDKPPRVGEEVAAIGHPRGLPLALTVGRVTSMSGEFDFGENLIQTDAVVAPGSSGGPLIDSTGMVVGIVILKDIAAEGLMYASDIEGARASLAEWEISPEPVEPAFCVGSVNLENIDQIAAEFIAADTDHPEIGALQRTFAVYTQSINSARAEDAFGVLGPAITQNNTPTAWAAGQKTSLLWDWRIRSVEEAGDGLRVRSVFTSTQDAAFGFDGVSTCTRWDITHTLIEGTFRGRPFWLINRSQATTGNGPVDCLEWEPEVVPKEQLVFPEVGASIRRADRLAGGTVHDWDIGLGPLPEDEDQTPVVLVVTVDATNADFDPFIEVRDQFGSVIAENDDRGDESLNSQVEVEVSAYQVLSVYVSDLADRSGGQYSVTFANAAG